MKQPFIIKQLNKFNPNGVYGVGNQPTNTMLVATENVNGVDTVTQIKITDGVTPFSSLKNLVSSGDSVPMTGIPAGQFMQNTFVIGNKAIGAILGSYDYRTSIDDKILYNYGDTNKIPYQDSTSFGVNSSGFYFTRRNVNFQDIPQGSTIQADGYASIISFRGLNNYDNEVRTGELESHMASKKIVVNDYYTTTISTRAAEQDVLIKIEVPSGQNTEYRFDKDDGLVSDKDFSAITTDDLAFAQQRYVNEKVNGTESTIDLNPYNVSGNIRLEKHGKFAFAKITASMHMIANESISIALPNTFGNSLRAYQFFYSNILGMVKISTTNAGIQISNPSDDEIDVRIDDCFIFDLVVDNGSD